MTEPEPTTEVVHDPRWEGYFPPFHPETPCGNCGHACYAHPGRDVGLGLAGSSLFTCGRPECRCPDFCAPLGGPHA